MGRPTKAKSTTLQFERERLFDIINLKLDSKNNRTTHLKLKNDKELGGVLWKQEKLQSLYRDILYRGLQEPLILHPSSTTVAEGNCRLVCLQKLREEAKGSDEPALQKFKKVVVPCKRIAKATPTADIDAYLTEIHVGRKRKWPEYNQAKLLYKLKNSDNLLLEEISRIARSSRPIVSRKINCYTLTKKYHENFPNDDDFIKKFYYFWEFLHPDLDKFREKESNVKKFMKWVYYEKFPTSKHVRDIPKILKNKRALAKFELTDMEQAVKILLTVDPTIRSPLYRNIYKITTQLNNFSNNELTQIVGSVSRKMMIEQLKKSADNLLKIVNQLERREKVLVS